MRVNMGDVAGDKVGAIRRLRCPRGSEPLGSRVVGEEAAVHVATSSGGGGAPGLGGMGVGVVGVGVRVPARCPRAVGRRGSGGWVALGPQAVEQHLRMCLDASEEGRPVLLV